MNNRINIFILTLFEIAAFSGCTTALAPVQDNIIQKDYQQAPAWVFKGCSNYWNKAQAEKLICGVGAAEGIKNPNTARQIAIGRARADLAKKMRTTVISILKDYQAVTTVQGVSGTDALDEQHIEIVTKEITDMNFSGTEIVDSWMSDSGTYYVLVVLYAERFKENVQKMDSLSVPLKNTIREQADEAFEELDRSIQAGMK